VALVCLVGLVRLVRLVGLMSLLGLVSLVGLVRGARFRGAGVEVENFLGRAHLHSPPW
jgi:hypothetical protein